MKALFLIFLLLAGFTAPTKSCLSVDIMLVADMSGSVDGHQKYIANAMLSFIDRFDLSESSVKIGITIFNSDAYMLSPLTSDKEKLRRIILALGNSSASGTTRMEKGLYQGATELQYGRKVTKMLVVISDGAPDEKITTSSASQEIKEFGGIGICGVYVGSNVGDVEYLRSICTEGCFSETSYSGLADELKKLDICL